MSLSHCRLPLHINHGVEARVVRTELSKGLVELQLVSRDGTSTSRESQVFLDILRASFSGKISCLSHVSCEDNEVEIFVDVVHDLITELGFSNIFSELLDTSATSLWCSIFVNNLVTFILGSSSILESADKLFDNLKLSSEEGILLGVHGISVHLEKIKIDSRNSFNKTLKRSIDLELFE